MGFLSNDTTVRVLDKCLSAYTTKHRIIANNIANVTTPGYQKKEVIFEEKLLRALHDAKLEGTRTDSAHFNLGRVHIEQVNPETVLSKDTTLPNGINNVDIDKEMVALTENTMKYNMAISFLQRKINGYKMAISGR